MLEQLDPETERRMLKAEALLDDFTDKDEMMRLCRAIVTLFLVSGERDTEGCHRLDIDAALSALAIGVTLFLRAVRGPEVVVDLHASEGGDRIAMFRGAPPDAAPPEVH